MLFVTNLSFKRTISLHNAHIVVVFLHFENTCDSTPPTILWCGFSIPHLQAEIIGIVYQKHRSTFDVWSCVSITVLILLRFLLDIYDFIPTLLYWNNSKYLYCNSALFHLYRDTYYKYVPLATSFEFVAFSLPKGNF